jgi:hypothetical protein
MNPESARHLPCTGEALPGSQVIAQNAKNNLGEELFANGYFALTR